MDVKETFYRAEVLESVSRKLPAEVYNLAHLLLVKSDRDSLFVPIRSMQFIAVMDKEEIIFVHSAQKQLVKLNWHHFQPQVRESLSEPVPYEVNYYHPEGPEIMLRLQGEFNKAIHLLADKLPTDEKQAAVLSFPKGSTSSDKEQ